MHINDGRVVSNFIIQALQNEPLTVSSGLFLIRLTIDGSLIQIYGDGQQTRSFQYVSDLINGLIALMASNVTVPVNIGNPEEYTIKEFAILIKETLGQ